VSNNLSCESIWNRKCCFELRFGGKQILKTGNHEMNELISAMESIGQFYSEITGFVGTIQDITAQTNLLSLNASIEAARAGEAGRGFAVVASEISTLAASSAQTSDNIDKLIVESQSAVSSGKELVAATSETIQHGMDDSVQSKQYMDEIVGYVKGAFAEMCGKGRQFDKGAEKQAVRGCPGWPVL